MTSRNFLDVTRCLEEMSYVFSFNFFSLRLIFTLHWGHFSFCHRRYKIFLLSFQQKNVSFVFFISRFRSLSPFFLLSFAGLPPTSSFSLSFSCSIFQICGHDNLSKLNTLDNTDTETISVFCFFLYWALVVSALQDAGGYAISHQNNLELQLGCHTCWLSYFNLVYLWCGGTVSCRQSVCGQVITKFSGMGRFTYPGCSTDVRLTRERAPLLIISHITFRDCRVHIFSHNLSRNSCKRSRYDWKTQKNSMIIKGFSRTISSFFYEIL